MPAHDEIPNAPAVVIVLRGRGDEEVDELTEET
jgi:hypothetical protein